MENKVTIYTEGTGFYSIKRTSIEVIKGTEKFYAGPRTKWELRKYKYNGKEFSYSVSVTIGAFWRDTYFWSCKKKSTLKEHLSDIYKFSDFRFNDLEIEKCFVGKTEIVKDTDIYSKYELDTMNNGRV